MPLEGPDQLHLRAAHGYVELEMFEEANAELEEIDPFCRHSPEVLLARLVIYHGLGNGNFAGRKETSRMESERAGLFRRACLRNQRRNRFTRDSDAGSQPPSKRRDDPVQPACYQAQMGSSRAKPI